MAEADFDRLSASTSKNIDELWHTLLDAKRKGTLPVGAERERLWEEYKNLDRLRHELNAARGRRTWKSIYGAWPHFLSE